MATVETVRGPVDTAQLGRTLMHEHIFTVSPENVENYGRGAWWDEEARVDDAAERLRALAAKGIRTIVDATVLGLGRNVSRVKRVADLVPEMNVIVGTGLYSSQGEIPTQYARQPHQSTFGGGDAMTADFSRDIEVGIGQTGVKAAFLKFALDDNRPSQGTFRILFAIAHVFREIKTPVIIHTNGEARTGTLAHDLCSAEGIFSDRIMIAHAGDSNDLSYLLDLIDRGVLLGMDRFGMDSANSSADRVATVAELCRRGLAEHLVLGHDASCFTDWFPPAPGPTRNHLLNWHHEHIVDDVVPALRDAGVADKDIDAMLIANPARWWSGFPL